MRFAFLMVEHIRHNVIEAGKDYSAVHGIFKTDVILGWREFRGAPITYNRKVDAQTDRVVDTASKTHGRRFD
jgi:hypothetical protein